MMVCVCVCAHASAKFLPNKCFTYKALVHSKHLAVIHLNEQKKCMTGHS